MKLLAWSWHSPGCAYPIALGAKEADDEASRLTAVGWPRLAHRSV
jgi:hypothetical protein